MWKSALMLGVFASAALPCLAQLHQYKPGFNFFTRDQDVRLGKEASGEIEKQVEAIDNKELTAYINSIGSKLIDAAARAIPESFRVPGYMWPSPASLPGDA